MYNDEEICVCFTELCNFGDIQEQTILGSTAASITSQIPTTKLSISSTTSSSSSTEHDTQEN